MIYIPNGPTICINCPMGPKGDTGVCVTNNYGYAANINGATIVLPSLGTYNLRLSTQELSTYITANGNNDVFTISNAGTYYIKYQIYTTLALLMSSRLIINGSPYTASIVSPTLSLSSFSAEVIVNLTAASTVSLQIYNTSVLGLEVILPSGSCGASLSIIRLA